MNPQAIAQALNDRKAGQFVTVFISRKAHLRKEFEHMDIRKNSRVQLQLADYANRAPVKEAVEKGTRDAPELPKHISHVERIGLVKFWIGHNGKTYLPYPVIGTNTTSDYVVDGCKIVDPESIKPYCLAKEFPNRPSKDALAERGQVPFIAVGVEHVVAVR